MNTQKPDTTEEITKPAQMDTMGILDDGKIDIQDAKRVLASKTVWVNLLAFVAFFLQSKYGYVMDEGMQAQILTIINIGLRYVTSTPIVWGGPEKASK
jgi:hypothetical protein